MRILHIHQDYPDGLNYPFTRAVENLIDACKTKDESITHTVLSINRTSNPLKVSSQSFEQGIAVIYWAIPLPFVYPIMMWLSYIYLYRKIKHIDFNLIHGHTLTTEGWFAYLVSKRSKKPYVLSIRGGTDQHNFSRLSIHIKIFKKIYESASEVFFVSPWMGGQIKKLFNTEIKEKVLFPNICIINPLDVEHLKKSENKFITCASFTQYKRKGLIPLIHAISILRDNKHDVMLDIYGNDNIKHFKIIQNEISKLNLGNHIKIKSNTDQKSLRVELMNSKGFILPSINETFGMTYIEALSVDCPIIYMENTGIDGYFDFYKIGIKLKNQEPDSIASAIIELNNNSNIYKQGIDKMKNDLYLKEFTGEKVSGTYLTQIKKIDK